MKIYLLFLIDCKITGAIFNKIEVLTKILSKLLIVGTTSKSDVQSSTINKLATSL